MTESSRADDAGRPMLSIVVLDDRGAGAGPRVGGTDAPADDHQGQIERITVDSAAAGPVDGWNRGIGLASGTWITFRDAADRPGAGELDRLLEAAAGLSSVALIRPRSGWDAGRPGEARVADLTRSPLDGLGIDHTALFRVDHLRTSGMRFNAEAGLLAAGLHLAARVLLDLPQPVIGIAGAGPQAEGRRVRRRGAGRAPVAASRAWPAGADGHELPFADAMEHGYVDLLTQATARAGAVPPWLQHVLIAELARLLDEEERPATRIAVPDVDLPRFHAGLTAVLSGLDADVVGAHPRLKPRWRDLLAHAGRDLDWHAATAAETQVDRAMRLRRVTYRFVGTPPTEQVTLGGVPVEPAWAKTQEHAYVRRPLIHTRILWVPLDPRVSLAIDGTPVDIGRERDGGVRIRLPDREATGLARRVLARWARFDAGRPAVRSRYRDAWVLMDRPDAADDNAERLFEHLREHRPDINAWFAISDASPDFARLRSTYGARVIPRRSRAFRRLMLNASWLVSSHADRAIVAPPELAGIIERPTWRFAFLQHGVTKDDLSAWLDRKQADLFVVSTRAELASVVADGTGYGYTGKETRNTGLPRFDRLLRKAEVESGTRDLVLVAPTWRSWLATDMDEVTFRRDIDGSLWDSEYLRSWLAILGSPPIAAAAERASVTLGFMPHPAMQPILARLDLPGHVRPLRFAGEDVQGLYARCALLVTDYSSVAFNVAYIDRPVVYFQFDREAVLNGQHLGRAGYFDYRRDGFGPVATTAAGAVAAIIGQLERGTAPTPEYQARIDEAFPQRDGRACERVIDAIEELSRPYPWPSDIAALLDPAGRSR